MGALRSDAYVLTEDFRVVLHEDLKGVPPNIKLDGSYKFVDQMEGLIPEGPPSLRTCAKLTIDANLSFASGVVIKGEVTIKNPSSERIVVPAGTYENQTVDVSAVEPPSKKLRVESEN